MLTRDIVYSGFPSRCCSNYPKVESFSTRIFIFPFMIEKRTILVDSGDNARAWSLQSDIFSLNMSTALIYLIWVKSIVEFSSRSNPWHSWYAKKISNRELHGRCQHELTEIEVKTRNSAGLDTQFGRQY